MTVRAGSPDTQRIYERDFAAFAAWCGERGVPSLPAQAEDVAGYLAERARTDRPATLSRRVASIARAHEDNGLDSPTRSYTVRSLLKAIRRQGAGGTAATAGASAAPPPDRVQAAAGDIAAMADAAAGLAESLAGKRDRALILLTFAASMRRGELATLDRSQIELFPEGATLRLPARGREPGEGVEAEGGETVAVRVPRREGAPHCPVAALEAWLDGAGVTSGPVFRPVTLSGRVQDRAMTGHAIAEIIKRAAAAAGRDPRRFSVQSLRARPAAAGGADGQLAVRLLHGEVSAEEGDPVAPLETAVEAVAVFDREFRYRFVNGRLEGFTRRTRAELLGRALWDVYPHIAETQMGAVLRRSMEQREYLVYGFESVVRPGTLLEVRCVPYGGNSPSGGLMVFFHEVNRPAPLASFSSGAEKLGTAVTQEDIDCPAVESLLDALPHIVWTSHPDGTLRSLNRQWYRYTGAPPWHPSEPPSVAPYVHPEDWEAVIAAIRIGMAGGGPFEFEYRLRRADGEYRRHLARLIPVLRAADGGLSHWLGTGTEIGQA